MARLIVFSDYLSGKTNKTHILENLEYIGTRDGVQIDAQNIDQYTRTLNPATAVYGMSDKQHDLIQSLLETNSDLKDMISYEKFSQNSNMYTASAFIAEAIERLYLADGNNETYLKYISERPGVEKHEEMMHGLFDQAGIADMKQYHDELSNYEGNVWRHIISMRREDAVIYGFENKEAWKNMIQSHIHQWAHDVGIDADHLRWVAAFHDEGYHPHVHMMVWSTNREGFQNKEALNDFRKSMIKDVFSDELWLREQYKAEMRDDFENIFQETTQEIMDKAMRSCKDTLPALAMQLQQLAAQLPDRKTQSYAYLKPELKNQVKQIIESVLSMNQVESLMNQYLDAHRILGSMYMVEGSNAMETYLNNAVEKLIDPGKGDRKKLQNFILKVANDYRQEDVNKKILLSQSLHNIMDKLQDPAYVICDPKLGQSLMKLQMLSDYDPLESVQQLQSFFMNTEDAMESYLCLKNDHRISKKEIQMIEHHFQESILYDQRFVDDTNTLPIHEAGKILQHILMALEDGKLQADQEAHRLFIAHRMDERDMKVANAKR